MKGEARLPWRPPGALLAPYRPCHPGCVLDAVGGHHTRLCHQLKEIVCACASSWSFQPHPLNRCLHVGSVALCARPFWVNASASLGLSGHVHHLGRVNYVSWRWDFAIAFDDGPGRGPDPQTCHVWNIPLTDPDLDGFACSCDQRSWIHRTHHHNDDLDDVMYSGRGARQSPSLCVST